MPRPKKADQKPTVEKPKSKGTAKRRKDKEEDADDLEEFEEKPEKKLKVEGKNQGKAKIYILGHNRMETEFASAGIHTFNSLASALEFRKGLIKKFERGEDEEEDGDGEDDGGGGGGSGIYSSFDKKLKQHIYNGACEDGSYSIIIKEITFDQLLAGEDVNIQLSCE